MNVLPIYDQDTKECRYALVVSCSQQINACIKTTLEHSGIISLRASTAEHVFRYLQEWEISYILIDVDFDDAKCEDLVRSLRIKIGESYIPIIIIASADDSKRLAICATAGSDDILFKPVTSAAINARISSLDKIGELTVLYNNSINEQILAKRILSDAISQRCIHFDEIHFLSSSKEIFSGDLFLIARHPDGSLNILLADFTGHGLSAAIGALPVADVFSAMTEKGFDLACILESINSKLLSLLPTSMFLACSVLRISSDVKQVTIWNGGMPDIYLRGIGNGNIKHKIKSSHLPLGIIDTLSNNYRMESFNITPGDQLILFTDGLTEALNKNNDMFGENRLESCLNETVEDKSVFTEIVACFNDFCGDIKPVDDITLACIPCTNSLMLSKEVDNHQYKKISYNSNWCWYMELGGRSLHELNPVPIVIDEIQKISGLHLTTKTLANIMSALYENVIVERSWTKNHEKYTSNSMHYVKIGIKKVSHNGFPSLLIQMEDSGKEINLNDLAYCLLDEKSNDKKDKEYSLSYKLNELTLENNTGNCLEAIVCSHKQIGI